MSKHLIRFQEKENASMRLFCFPYAGGGAAAFRSWGALLPPDIELVAAEYPGRIQLKDQAATNMDELIDVIYPEVLAWLDKPFAFFGHSYGSIVAFALARRLQQEKQPMPQHLFVSSRRPPHFLSDDEFVKAIQIAFGPIPPAVLNDEALLKLFLPLLKGDIEINEEYLSRIDPPLNIPVTTYYGTEDTSGSCIHLDRWKEVTTGSFALKSFPGGHFYVWSTILEKVFAAS
jgi:medium-chain acyl-[acyl-carrier-protein] hydrolase